MKKKHLLIAYGNPYVFNGVISPLIPKLSDLFDISLVTINLSLSDKVVELFDRWAKLGVIKGYFIVPVYQNNHTEIRNGLRLHVFMKSKLKLLREQRFDICIMGSSVQILDRYIVDCVLPRECIVVGLWASGFTVGLHPSIVRAFLEGEAASRLILKLVNPWFMRSAAATSEIQVKKSPILWFASKWRKNPSLLQLARKMPVFVFNKLSSYINKLSSYISGDTLSRYIYPALLVRKTFPLGKYDNPTWFDTDRFNAIIVLQKFPELFLKSLYENADVFLAQSPLAGSCRCCSERSESSTVLVCLSGFEGSEEQEYLLYRDLQIVMSESGARMVHIRPHPREIGPHLEKLRVYLQERNIASIVVGTEQPIREIICNYMGVVGCTSTSLWEARTACDYAFVVGFVAISKTYAENPKYLFGDIEGLETRIDWIEEDGSHRPGIFTRRYHSAPDYRSIPEILMELDVANRRATDSL